MEGAPAEDADLPGGRNWMRTRYFREETPRYERRMNMTIVGMNDGPTGAVKNSMAESVGVGTGRTDMRWPMMLVILGRAGWDRGIHNHSQIRDGPMPTDVPVDDMDVRTILGVGEERQGGRTRPSEDACDSLVLWGREAVGGLVHRRRVLDTDWWEMASHSRVDEDNWGLALDARDQGVGRAHHKWRVALAGDKSVVHPAAAASPHCSSNADMPCARAQRLAPATRPV